MIAVHVDDDLIAGSEEFFENQVAKLKKLHCYGKWKTAFMHCGRFLQQTSWQGRQLHGHDFH